MLRISRILFTDGLLVLRLSGRIGRGETSVLEEQLRQDRGPQGLDLTGVDFIDEVGLDLLQRWIDRGLQLRGGSAFIRKLLEARGLSPPAPPHHPDSRRTPS